MQFIVRAILVTCLVLCAATTVAAKAVNSVLPSRHFYVAFDAGISQNRFGLNASQIGSDLSPKITANPYQTGFTGSVALGYLNHFKSQGLYGLALRLRGAAGKARYADNRLLTDDTIQNPATIDLDAQVGLSLTSQIRTILQVGPSLAYVQDSITSPAGLFAVPTTTKQNKWLVGVHVALKGADQISRNWFVFCSYDFHYYAKTSFSDFANHQVNYSRKNGLVSSNYLIGLGRIL